MAYTLARWRPHPRAHYLPGIIVAIIRHESSTRSLIRWREPGLLYSYDQPLPEFNGSDRHVRAGQTRNTPKRVVIVRQRIVPSRELSPNITGLER